MIFKRPLISVIVPNYNHAHYLEERLDCIFNQTYENFEVILLDDASSDESLTILNKYKNHPKVVHAVFSSKNSGSPFLQWQRGVSLAEGDYIWIAESDDYCDSTFLEQLVGKLNKTIKIAYAQSLDVDVNSKIITNRINYTNEFSPNIWESDFVCNGRAFILNYLSLKNVIPNASAVVFSRNLINNNIFDKDLLAMSMCGDWFFWIKLIMKGDVAFVAKPLNYFRDHENVTRKHKSVEIKKKRYIEESIVRSYLSKELNIFNKEGFKLMLQKWFLLNGIKDVFTGSFFNIKTYPLSKINFVIRYLSYKLKKG